MRDHRIAQEEAVARRFKTRGAESRLQNRPDDPTSPVPAGQLFRGSDAGQSAKHGELHSGPVAEFPKAGAHCQNLQPISAPIGLLGNGNGNGNGIGPSAHMGGTDVLEVT